jgi:hypothetical protein
MCLTVTLRKGIVISVSVLLATALTSSARGQHGPGVGGSGGRDQRPPPGDQRGDSTDTSGDTGSVKGTIQRLAPAKEEYEDLIGTLSFKLENNKSLRLEWRRDKKPRVRFGDKEISEDEVPSVVVRGAAAVVDWDTEKRGKRKVKYVTSVTFDTITIEGQVIKIHDDTFVLRGVPANNADWPDPHAPRRPDGAQRRAQSVRPKPVKIKYLADLSKIVGESDQSMIFGDIQEDQRISAEVVYISRESLLIRAKVSGTEPAGGEEGGRRVGL